MGVRVVFSERPQHRIPSFVTSYEEEWTLGQEKPGIKRRNRKSMTFSPRPSSTAGNLVQVEFEVWGSVQGFYFRKYTRDLCQSLDVRGWVKLTNWGTVVGELQGEKEKVDEVAMWLRLQGAPGSKIERCDFRHWRMIDTYDFHNFQMRF
ncbi:acylphosphatase-2-like [Ornithodoros turicata]|uniref:acylphosphatase n=1 Tax=Ornithodoros turicata TaxID=34597 RepID=A0A2R5LF70_9ACAR